MAKVEAGSSTTVEVKRHGTPVICTNCKHCSSAGFKPTASMSAFAVIMAASPRCRVSRKDFVGNGPMSFNACADVNTDGRCPQFEQFQPAPEPKKPRPWRRFIGRTGTGKATP